MESNCALTFWRRRTEFLGLAFLEDGAQFLVIIEVLLLAVDAAVHDDVTVAAFDLSGLLAHRADSEVWSYIWSSCNFVWYKVLIVSCVWLSTKSHEELCNIDGASYGGEV